MKFSFLNIPNIDLMQFAAVFISICALGFSIISYRINNSKEKKEILFNLYLKIFSDKNTLIMYNRISKSEVIWNNGNFINNDDETYIDTILIIFDSIAKLKESKVIGEEEVNLILPDMKIVYNNQSVKDYIHWLKIEYEKEDKYDKGNYFGYYKELCDSYN